MHMLEVNGQVYKSSWQALATSLPPRSSGSPRTTDKVCEQCCKLVLRLAPDTANLPDKFKRRASRLRLEIIISCYSLREVLERPAGETYFRIPRAE